jgi:hypothetical protein
VKELKKLVDEPLDSIIRVAIQDMT